MSLRAAAVVTAWSIVMFSLVPAAAASASGSLPACSPTVVVDCVEVAAAGDAWTSGGTSSDSGSAGQGSSNSEGSTGGATGPVVRRETRLAPTCTGNSVDDAGVLCNAAVETCPVDGEIRFWKWQRTYDDDTDAWSRWTLIDTLCLGPDDPAVDPAAAIPAIVQRDFQSVVVLKGAADVSPKPDTLVNIATRFRTDAPASYEIPLSILGQAVVITAKAEKYTWHFGDGNSTVSYASNGATEHTYRKAVREQAYVVISWSGTFTVNGGPRQAINGTVSTTGDPVDVNVREARSELVRD